MAYIFYCDESYDPPKSKGVGSKSYVVGGFFGDDRVWQRVEQRWVEKNKRVRVTRFHASQLNAGTNEFEGKSKNWRVRYSRDMLRILKDQKRRLHGLSCGIHVDDYRSIITPEGQIKMGHPYLVCFKTVICRVAGFMSHPKSGFAPGDRFSVVLDRNDLDDEAVKIFYKMKADPAFTNRSRLEDCVSGGAELFVGLQPADFVAYETFRLMHGQRNGVTAIRQALNGMFGTTGFFGDLFDDRVFRRIRDDVDAMPSVPDGFVIVPPAFESEHEQPPESTVRPESFGGVTSGAT
jgi:hypothetical protein